MTRKNPGGPTIIGFSLPQLLSRVQNILPRMQESIPRMEKMPTMDEIFSRMEGSIFDEEEEDMEEEKPSIEFSLPSMGQVFSRIEESLPNMEQKMEPLMNRVMEIEIENPFDDFEEFEETPRMSMPRFPENLFGRKDHDEFDFGGLVDQLTNRIMSSQFSQSWSPFGQPEMGKLTVDRKSVV